MCPPKGLDVPPKRAWHALDRGVSLQQPRCSAGLLAWASAGSQGQGGFSQLNLGITPKIPVPGSRHPAHPNSIPAEGFSMLFWQRQPKGLRQDCCAQSLEQAEGQRDPRKGQEREAASRSQAGDSQEAEGICP